MKNPYSFIPLILVKETKLVIRHMAVALLVAVFFLTPSAQADWINLSGAMSADNIAEFHVADDHVKVVLEIYVKDLHIFTDLIPDKMVKAGVVRPPEKLRLQRFASETLRIIADMKETLPVTVQLVEPRMRIERPNPFAGMINPYTRQRVPGPPEDKRVLYVELAYPFADGTQPKTLTFEPPKGKDRLAVVSMGFIAYHQDVPVMDYRYLSEPAVMTLDWQDPWYSSFKNKQFKRFQQSGVLTYLYMEPFEVRHETLIRVKDLEAWMGLGLRGNDFIEADEFEPLKEKIGQFLLKHSRVTIDCRSLRPILDRTSFVKRTMTRTYFINQPERMPLNTAMVGVIVTYLTKQLPQKVEMEWTLFSDRIQKVPTSAIDPAGPFPSYVTPDDNILVWKNFLKTYQVPTVNQIEVDKSLTSIPVSMVTLICALALIPTLMLTIRHRQNRKTMAGCAVLAIALIVTAILLSDSFTVSVARPAAVTPKISEDQAVKILDSLLKNVYRSFDFRNEEDVYDRLATSVSGDLLTDIYLQNRQSLVVTQAGGAQARVKAVEILSVDIDNIKKEPLGLLFHAQWTAEGTVGHWGHIHTRKNRYKADITVIPTDGFWKIRGLDLIEEKRIDRYGQPIS